MRRPFQKPNGQRMNSTDAPRLVGLKREARQRWREKTQTNAKIKGKKETKRDSSLRKPTGSQERAGKKKRRLAPFGPAEASGMQKTQMTVGGGETRNQKLEPHYSAAGMIFST